MKDNPTGDQGPTARTPAPSGTDEAQERALAMVEIREMELDDLPAVFALGERVFRASEFPNLYRTWDEYELVDSYSSDGELCLVAEDGECVVGFVIGTVIRKRKSAWTYGYLVWLAVEPDLEGRGVARKLVARLTELLIEAGARIMLVDTDAQNARGLAFFERVGFGQPVQHVYLSKNLTQLPQYQRRRQREHGEDVDPAQTEPRKAPDA